MRKTILGLFSAAFLLTASHAMAAKPVEACTHKSWGFLTFVSYHFGTLNTCGYAVHVWFQLPNGTGKDAEVAPSAWFDSGLSEADMPDRGWFAAICRVPLVPSPEVTASNRDAILHGLYTCVKR